MIGTFNKKEVRAVRLESQANANPMTYLGASGLQRIAIVAGDRINVYALLFECPELRRPGAVIMR